jgi:hypothetical protein
MIITASTTCCEGVFSSLGNFSRKEERRGNSLVTKPAEEAFQAAPGNHIRAPMFPAPWRGGAGAGEIKFVFQTTNDK